MTYALSLGVPAEAIKVSESMNTSYRHTFGIEILYIGTDVMPNPAHRDYPTNANLRISMKGAIAHEVVGHRAAELRGKTHPDPLLEEAQASIRAARFAPDLTQLERIALLRDAAERLHRAGLRISEVRDKIWIDEAGD